MNPVRSAQAELGTSPARPERAAVCHPESALGDQAGVPGSTPRLTFFVIAGSLPDEAGTFTSHPVADATTAANAARSRMPPPRLPLDRRACTVFNGPAARRGGIVEAGTVAPSRAEADGTLMSRRR